MKTEILRGLVPVAAVALLAPAWAAGPGGSGTPSKNPAVTLQPIPGSPAKRVILTQKASERLGIETGKVSEQPIVRKQMVGGIVVPPVEKSSESKPGGGAPAPVAGGGFAGFAGGSASRATLATAIPAAVGRTAKDAPPVAAPAGPPVLKEAWLLVTMTQGEWERLAKDKPARVLPLATRDKLANAIMAKPAGMEPEEDSRRSMLKVYYIVPGKDHGLELNKRMRVELPIAGSDETHKVVPYSAVYYDAKGAPWVYVNTQPLTYERQRITVDRVEGDVAVLSDGPPIGTPIVVTGAPLLYGTEIFGK
jgi:hypothetical protein